MRPLVLLAALALPFAAHADPKDDARRHFAAGLSAAQDGDFEIALQRFLAAQEAYPHPATLYNIAKAYQDLDDDINALTYYRLYRDAQPDSAKQVDPVIAALEARRGAPAPEPTTGPAGVPGEVSGVALVVTGPTPEELARLSEISAELEALSTTIQDRTNANLPAAPTEVARQQGIAVELAALTEAIKARVEEDTAAARAGTLAGGENVIGPPPGPDGGVLGVGPPVGPDGTPDTSGLADVPEIGWLTDAYEKIVVTASRVGQDPLDSPSTLTVLTDEDIRLSGITNIPDLLRRVVGVDVMSPSSGQTNVSIRGFNRKLANKVLILIDGRSTYYDFIGATLWMALPITLEEIERIEVIRGPGSAVYGANAVTGVVNIITKKPGDVAMQGHMIAAEAGAPAYMRGTVYTNGRTKTVNYRLTAGYDQMGRWARGFPEDIDSVDYFFDNQDIGQRTFRGNGRIETTFGHQGFASLSAGFSNGNYEFHNIGALPPFGLDMRHHYVRGDVAWGALHVRAFWNADTGETGPWFEYIGQARTLDSPIDADTLDLEVEGPIEFDTGSAHHTLNLGAGYRNKRVKFDYLQGGFDEPRVEHHFSAFANEQVAIGRFGAVASLRVDRHPLLKLSETLSPRLAVLVRPFEKTSVRATVGRAFRQPNSIESYMDFQLNNPAADGVFIRDVGGSDKIRGGNPNLAPESVNTFELGIHDESTYLHTADAVVYVNQIGNLIGLEPLQRVVSVYDPSGNGILVGQTGWRNEDESFTGVGVEGELELYPTDGLDLFLNANWMRITSPSDNFEPNTVGNSPVKVNAGVIYRTPFRVDLSFSTHYLSKQIWRLRGFDSDGGIAFTDTELDSRIIANARIGVKPFEDDSLEIAANAWNFTALFGEEVIEHPEGQPVPAKTWGTLIYRF